MIKEDEPMDDYLSNEALGSSTLKQMLESPKDFKYSLIKKNDENASQKKGTMWHSYIIERENYLSMHMIQPEDWGPLNENPGKRKWDDFKKQAKELGKIPVKYKDAGELISLEKEMCYHKALKKIMGDYKPEVSFYAEIDGIKLKSREDIWCPKDESVWDVKTTSKLASSNKDINENLEDIVFQNGYHFSAAHHINVMKKCGIEVKTWGWIFVSTATPAPHIIIKKASQELLDAGQRDWNHAFTMLKECKKKDSWPGYDDEITEVGLPTWAERKFY